MVAIWHEIFKTEMEEDSAELVTQSLGITEVIQILENPPDTYITAPPVKPRAGQGHWMTGKTIGTKHPPIT